jgi:hypothetical protein
MYGRRGSGSSCSSSGSSPGSAVRVVMPCVIGFSTVDEIRTAVKIMTDIVDRTLDDPEDGKARNLENRVTLIFAERGWYNW